MSEVQDTSVDTLLCQSGRGIVDDLHDEFLGLLDLDTLQPDGGGTGGTLCQRPARCSGATIFFGRRRPSATADRLSNDNAKRAPLQGYSRGRTKLPCNEKGRCCFRSRVAPLNKQSNV